MLFAGQSSCMPSSAQTASYGSVSSMNYPKNYTSNAFCEWYISVPENKVFYFLQYYLNIVVMVADFDQILHLRKNHVLCHCVVK